MLCEAIRQEKLVSLKYPGDTQAREFEPGIIFQSSMDKIEVFGHQLTNPNVVDGSMQPRSFEIGKIISLSMTEKPFVVRGLIDVRDPKYANGIICYFGKP